MKKTDMRSTSALTYPSFLYNRRLKLLKPSDFLVPGGASTWMTTTAMAHSGLSNRHT